MRGGKGGSVIQQIGGRIECVSCYRSTLDSQDIFVIMYEYQVKLYMMNGGVAPRIPDICKR